MENGEFFIFVMYLGVSGLFAGLGVPLVLGMVPPNMLYGFRTPRTLNNPSAWYPANRVTGLWMIATGLVTAAVDVYVYMAGIQLPAAAWSVLAPVMTGILAMVIHGVIVARRTDQPAT